MNALLKLWRHLSQHHHVLRNFVLRDLKVKYRGTVFGYLWSLLEPLSLVGIYWFVFVVIARRGGPDYPLVVILGVLPYQFFNVVVSSGATALSSNAALIRRVYLPRQLFVIASVASNLVVLGLSFLVCVPFLFAYGVEPGPRLLALPLALAAVTAFSTGLALVLACANTLYRDVGYVLRVVLRLLFYASPVIYSVDMVPDRLQTLYLLNPVAVYLSAVRASLMNHAFPFGFVHGLLAAVAALVSLYVGATLFERWERKAVKFL